MKLRPYTRSDVAEITTIHATSNKTDSIVRYVYPECEKYPTSYRLGVWRFIRSITLAPGSRILVVETEASDYPPADRHKAPEVVAYAKYTRTGESDAAKEWRRESESKSESKSESGSGSGSYDSNSWRMKFERFLISLEDRYYVTFPGVQPAWSYARSTAIRPLLHTPWDAEIFPEALELSLLFVRPDWQRRGIGRKLMQWGFDQAQSAKIPVVVKSSALGAASYRACGFKEIATLPELGQFFDVTEFGGEQCKTWVWEPELDAEDRVLVEGKWHERALEKLAATAGKEKNIEELKSLDVKEKDVIELLDPIA